MARKQRIDSMAGALEVASKAGLVIEPPADVVLIDGAEPHFRRAIAARPAVAWNDEAVAFAAAYANHMASLFRLQVLEAAMNAEDFMGKPGSDIRQAIHGKASLAKQARQSLGLHDRGTNGEKRDSAKHDRIAREIEAGLVSGDGDAMGLLN